MFITEIILEGFKSYATRTVISGWDPEFNAITGLNGSGKSNILDSICFVLGISNLSQVRASSLQDLVYKKGQAGISKASVTIVFDNSDPRNCPIGYERDAQITVTRQIVIKGKNKYLINGHNVPQKAVSNLFQSVQLNVNNPHFLIMQGRITKVLNMKPPETLSMIEEAAGTRMFEDKKESAISTITKKEKKLEEIQSLLREEITPKLDKLKKEKTAYLEYQKTEAEVERLKKIHIAYEYKINSDKLNTSEHDLQLKNEKIEELQSRNEKAQQEHQETTSQIKQLTKRKQKELGSQLENLEFQVNKLSEHLVRSKTQCDHKVESLKEEKKNHEISKKEREELLSFIQQKENELAKEEEKFKDSKLDHETKTEEVKKLEELIAALSTGMNVSDSEKCFSEQLQDSKNHANSIATETTQAKVKLDHLQSELKVLEPKAKKLEKENASLQKSLEQATKTVEKLESELNGLKFQPEREASLIKQKASEEEIINGLKQRINTLSSKLSNLQFTYTDPTPNFDRRDVKGLVAELIEISEQNFDASTALEVAAGGRLYNVVVKDEKVGSQLLEKGKLQKRVTIIPLNKIQPFSADPKKVEKAKQKARGKVDIALSFIGFNEEIRTAMEFVFGNTLICKDADTAREVTFSPDIKLRSVTYDGDLYDPQGTLTGGSAPTNANCLIKLQELKEVRKQLREHTEILNNICEELNAIKDISRKHGDCTRQLELKRHEVLLLQEQLAKTPYGQLLEQIEHIKEEIIQSQKIINSSESRLKEANEKCKKIEKEMNELLDNREGKLSNMKKELSKMKSDLSKSNQSFKKKQQALQTLKLEIEQQKEEIKGLENKIKSLEENIANYIKEENELKKEVANISDLYDDAKEELQAERNRLASFDLETKSLEEHQKLIENEINENELQIKKLNHDIQKYHKEKSGAANAIKAMETNHPWILDQRQYFGQAGTTFDFANQNFSDVRKRLEQLEEKQNKLGKNVNRKVMDMLDRVEKEEVTLKKKLAIVLNDKQKIEDTISTLEIKKKEAIHNTWEKVNHDFGAIFGDLLPGNSAKLDVPEGQDISQGLEIKVNLGGVWKQSLTELSGGQRSLVALSLILSLLCYKPAPLYILDEIDAALDLSHTQNIGQLLKNRFKGAQFIVVSLKEGMFTNANVLFKAKFRDGVSNVERYVQNQHQNQNQTTSNTRSSDPKGKKRMREDKENENVVN